MSQPSHGVTLAGIYAARRRIAGQAVRTPLVCAETLSRRFEAEILLKLETLQPTGASSCVASPT